MGILVNVQGPLDAADAAVPRHTGRVRTVFNIQVKNGIDIVPYSIFQDKEGEAEILMYPGSKFRVKDTMDMGAGLFMVHLEEIDVPVSLFG